MTTNYRNFKKFHLPLYNLPKVKSMDIYPSKDRWSRIILVLSVFLFIGFIIILAKVVGDGFLVPLIFVIGWIFFMSVSLAHFSKAFSKNKK